MSPARAAPLNAWNKMVNYLGQLIAVLQCRAFGPEPDPLMTTLVSRSSALGWPRYRLAISLQDGPIGSSSSAPAFLGSSL